MRPKLPAIKVSGSYPIPVIFASQQPLATRQGQAATASGPLPGLPPGR